MISRSVALTTEIYEWAAATNGLVVWTFQPQSGSFFANGLNDLFGTTFENGNFSLEEFLSVVHDSYKDRVTAVFDNLDKNPFIDIHFQLQGSLLDHKYIHMVAVPEMDNGITMLKGFFKDETAFVSWQQALQEKSEDADFKIQLLNLSEKFSDVGCIQINLAARKTLFSENVFHLLEIKSGFGPYQYSLIFDFIHAADRIAVEQAFAKSIRNATPLSLEFNIVTAQHKNRRVALASKLLFNKNGQQILVCFIRDISDKNSLVKTIEAYDEYLSRVEEERYELEKGTNSASWIVDLGTRGIKFSQNIHKILGIDANDPVSSLQSIIPLVHPLDNKHFTEAVLSVYNSQPPAAINYRIIKPNGKMRHLRTVCKLTADKKFMVGTIHDVTEETTLHAAYEEANNLLANAEALQFKAESVLNTGSWQLENGKLTCSDNFLEMMGVDPRDEHTWSSLADLVHHEDVHKFKELASTAHAEQQRLVRLYANGEMKHLKFHSWLHSSPENKPVIRGVLEDISENIYSKQKTSEAAHIFSVLRNTIPDIVMMTGFSNQVIEGNTALSQLLNILPDDYKNQNLFSLMPHLQDHGFCQHYHDALAGKTIHVPEFKGFSKGMVHDIRIIPFKDNRGVVNVVMTIARDVTTEFRLQRQLKERLFFIESLIENSIDRIVVLNRDFEYILWNKKAEEYYSRKKEDVCGKNIFEYYPSFKTDPYFGDFKAALAGKTVHVKPRKGNVEGRHESYLIPIKNEFDEVTSILWIVHELRS